VQRDVVLEKLVAPVVTSMGYIFVGLQNSPHGGSTLVRIYIDKHDGVTVEDCEQVSRQVDAVLEVETPETLNYTLEVSSPGLDRLLFNEEQFEQHIGKQVSIQLVAPLEGKRNYKGVITSVEKGKICIVVDEKIIVLSFSDIVEARLVPEWKTININKSNGGEA
jgi:ribosome maturation factor RimP